MSGRGGGAASVGCGAFGLLGVLISVGLVFWLASEALPDSTETKGSADPSDTAVGRSPEMTPDSPLVVTITPSTDLDEGATVTVEASGLPAGATATVATCLAEGGPVVTGDGCDSDSAATATADQSGTLSVDYRPARVVDTGVAPFDCAADAGTCVVRVAGPTENPATGSAPIGYRPGLPPPTLPGLPGG